MSPNQRRPALTLALALLLVALSWVTPVTRAQAPLDFKLKTTDGGEITSAMVRGDVVVLAFGSSLLGPLSKQQVQGVQELAEQFGARDVRVYWVTTDSDKPQARNYATDEQLRAFASKAGLKAAVLRDPDGALFKKRAPISSPRSSSSTATARSPSPSSAATTPSAASWTRSPTASTRCSALSERVRREP
jgi:peroxiredoxin